LKAAITRWLFTPAGAATASLLENDWAETPDEVVNSPAASAAMPPTCPRKRRRFEALVVCPAEAASALSFPFALSPLLIIEDLLFFELLDPASYSDRTDQ
jgi:hypothetical protein